MDIPEQIMASLSLGSWWFLHKEHRAPFGNMSRKRKDTGKLNRMTDFFHQPHRLHTQDGDGKHADKEHGRSSGHSDNTKCFPFHKHKPHQGHNYLSSSSTSSPVKANLQKAITEGDREDIETSLNDSREIQDSRIRIS